MRRLAGIFAWLPLFLVILLSGCGAPDTSDLQQYMKEVKQKAEQLAKNAPPLTLKPLPEGTIINYDQAASKRDPFVTWVKAPRKVLRQSGKGPKPNPNRRREALESFPLDSLRLTGTFKSGGEAIALVRSPDGVIHRVKKGNYLGTNYGKVVKITKTSVVLSELIANGLGGYERRTARLTMKK
ncbi:MAG: pilus assembly protein PilP [Gammaproteobacteria bacterium]|nr:MAG: pilus assembly protein PilP [Gammaproteobacteria bacterium]